MKLDKLSIDGKKDSLEVLDKIFSAKINKSSFSNTPSYIIKEQTKIIANQIQV